jgi:phosphatidylserine/phosphatidylglycerophosphate/cardiolipin synthase-like enzyme
MITDSLNMDKSTLAALISEFVKTTPQEIVQDVAIAIENWGDFPTTLKETKLLASIHSPQTKANLIELLDCWTEAYQTVTPQSFALSLRSSLITYQTSLSLPLELIWTGPEELSTGFRRTDQALLELIYGAKEQLLIVSFAVYKVQSIIDAIEQAILRNVKVTICLEDANETKEKISFSGSKAFSSSIFKMANFYTWPIENRPHTHDGKFGSLHAKLAVADKNRIFISSANLTAYAMVLNMEMGVLLEGGEVGDQITSLFNNMILNSTLRKYIIS